MIKITMNNWKEIWKPLMFDHDGTLIESTKYLISTFGRIKNINTGEFPKYGDYKGYKSIKFRENKEMPILTRKVHRLVGMTFIPNPDNLPYINHKEIGDPGYNFANNLEWTTPAGNYHHAIENYEIANFTIDEVKKIIDMMQEDDWSYDKILIELDHEKTKLKMHTLSRIYNKKIYDELSRDCEFKDFKHANAVFDDNIITKACELMQNDDWTYESIIRDLNIDASDKKIFGGALVKLYKGKTYIHISNKFKFKPLTKTGTQKVHNIDVICKYISEGLSNKDISRELNCHPSFIGKIRTKKLHTKVSDKYF